MSRRAAGDHPQLDGSATTAGALHPREAARVGPDHSPALVLIDVTFPGWVPFDSRPSPTLSPLRCSTLALEIIVGILIGRQLLAWVQSDEPVRVLVLGRPGVANVPSGTPT